MYGLPDYLGKDMIILFIGYNPGIRSAETGHHYAGKGNAFFPLLFQSGLIQEPLTPEDDGRLLPGYGYGLTNLVARPTLGIKDLTRHDYREGSERLRRILEQYRPSIAAYVGIGVYKHFTGLKTVSLGRREQSAVHGVADFVLPSTSGLNAIPLKEKVRWFAALRREMSAKRERL